MQLLKTVLLQPLISNPKVCNVLASFFSRYGQSQLSLPLMKKMVLRSIGIIFTTLACLSETHFSAKKSRSRDGANMEIRRKRSQNIHKDICFLFYLLLILRMFTSSFMPCCLKSKTFTFPT